MHSLSIAVALCLCFVFVQSQQGAYRDPCLRKRCGNYGCCVRRDPYYQRNRVFYRRAVCACDEHYYYHLTDDTCRHGCYQNTCHKQYATCHAKGRGEQYPGFARWNIYLNEYYYCTCNTGYRGNGRNCVKIDPCQNANCHQYASCHAKPHGSNDYPGYATNNRYVNEGYYCQCNRGYQGNGRRCDPIDPCANSNCDQYATCHPKPRGSTNYYNHNTYKGYVSNAYFCRCREDYYGNGRSCTHKCSDHSCSQYATCIPKDLGLGYPGSSNNGIYRRNYYYCQCNKGYTGNGRRCVVRDPCSNNNCHQWATCIAKPRGSTRYPNYGDYKGYVNNNYYCTCNNNYYGNGRQCTPHCGPTSCHSSATCVPKPYGSIDYPTYPQYPIYRNEYYYCDCPRGYWDGTRCRSSACHACHQYARCERKPCGSPIYPGYGNYRFYAPLCYYCECRKGYSGNGRQCINFNSGY